MDIDGACLCGAISFEANIDPANTILCHCTDCQKISSAPYRASVRVRIDNFKLRGEPKTYLKTGGSGNKVLVAFCGNCGTALYSGAPEGGTAINLRLGWVNQRAQLPPKRQGFCSSALPWAFDIREVERVQERPRRSS
jgi:hypothetical protein